MSYTAEILLPPDSSVTIEDVEEKIRNFYKKDEREVHIARDIRGGQSIQITIDHWHCYILLDTDPHVTQIAKRMAETYAAIRLDQAEIASCNRRFMIVCGKDPNMDYFNDYVYVLNIFESFSGTKVWEGASKEFL